ncbi:hypothetical protein [Alicyclobacillus sp.]|uniref:hypothetical protein n=1 Tax=Alicyclobacillus sp. TaxID=61169 RepID=UPI0025BA596A|nr:hypothetical protein [Alicyclobacillus sp.]MCL6516733.1 endolytic transglycosylase MltG [Alicyclobacillus sp.]
MTETIYSSNALMQSIVDKPFSRAISDLGLPDLTQPVFAAEMASHLKGRADGYLAHDPAALEKMRRAVLRGRVIAAEIWNGDGLVFYVQGHHGGQAVEVRLTCQSGQWKVQAVLGVHPLPWFQSAWFRRVGVASGMLAAAVIGYVLHQPAAPVARAAPTAPVTAATSAAPPTAATAQPAAASAEDATNASAGSPAATPKPRTVSFTLAPGMPVSKLALFLESEHLVPDAAAFDRTLKKTGADRTVRPGVYTFQEGMSEDQILQVLKRGPATR